MTEYTKSVNQEPIIKVTMVSNDFSFYQFLSTLATNFYCFQTKVPRINLVLWVGQLCINTSRILLSISFAPFQWKYICTSAFWKLVIRATRINKLLPENPIDKFKKHLFSDWCVRISTFTDIFTELCNGLSLQLRNQGPLQYVDGSNPNLNVSWADRANLGSTSD